MNASGQSFYPAWTNRTFCFPEHLASTDLNRPFVDYDPSSLLFDARHRKQVLASDAGLLAVLAGLSVLGYYQGLATVIKFYGIPYLYVNHWLVMVRHLSPQFEMKV